MLEQVYEIKFPTLSEILRPDFQFTENGSNNIYQNGYDLSTLLKPEFLKLAGFNWRSFRYFKKDNVIGVIHSDFGADEDPQGKCVWGVNWVWGGSGSIDYWQWQNVFRRGSTTGAVNDISSGIVPTFSTMNQPDFRYDTIENKIYLLNASLPHRSIGGPNRKVFSLRTDNKTIPWHVIVERFRDYIVVL